MPIGTTRQPLVHTTLIPPLGEAKVHHVMRVGVLSCPPDASLVEVARIMDAYRIHSVVVAPLEVDGGPGWGVVSDLDLASAVGAEKDDLTAGDVARTEPLAVSAAESVERAAQLMAEHEVTHLAVVDASTGKPLGMVSTLDLAAAVAWGGSS